MATNPGVEAAAAARRGKADPHRPPVSGGRRRLAELPGVDEPWWVRRARYLRVKEKRSYQSIADELGQPYRRVYVALNRERVRATNRAAETRNRKSLSARQMERRREMAPPCSRCGEKLTRRPQGDQDPLCLRCRKVVADMVYETVEELYRAGWPLREIDVFVGRVPGSAGAILSELRRRGVDLPRRYKPANIGDEANPDQGEVDAVVSLQAAPCDQD